MYVKEVCESFFEIMCLVTHVSAVAYARVVKNANISQY